MDLFKNFGLSSLTFIIPGIMTQLGMSLKNKDDNSTGYDDAGGNVVIAMAPVIPAFLSGNDAIIKRTLRAVRDVINNYLGEGSGTTN